MEEENLDESVQARIKACLSSLDENGNNVILLAKLNLAERAFVASLDSADFYLSQIEHPEKLAPKEQLRYAYLKGKIEFYTLGSQSYSVVW